MSRARSGSTSGSSGNGGSHLTETMLYQAIVEPSVDDPFLSENNLGLGNYSSREFWQQVKSFRKGLYAEAAFSRRLLDRAVYQTKAELAKAEFDQKVEEDAEEVTEENGIVRVSGHTKNEYIRAAGDRCWEQLGAWDDDRKPDPPAARLQALEDHAGLKTLWTPPHQRMVMARHEASRSRFSRLLDNVTGRIREFRGGDETVEEQLGEH